MQTGTASPVIPDYTAYALGGLKPIKYNILPFGAYTLNMEVYSKFQDAVAGTHTYKQLSNYQTFTHVLSIKNTGHFLLLSRTHISMDRLSRLAGSQG